MVDAVKQRRRIVVRTATAVQITGDRLYAQQHQAIDLCLGQTGGLVAQPVEVIGAGRYPQLAQLRQGGRIRQISCMASATYCWIVSISPVVLVGYEQGIRLTAIGGIQLLDGGEDFWCHSGIIAHFVAIPQIFR